MDSNTTTQNDSNSQSQIAELSLMEGPPVHLPTKPIKDMTDEELETFVQKMRDCLTNYQTLQAEARANREEKGKKKDPDGDLNMFE